VFYADQRRGQWKRRSRGHRLYVLRITVSSGVHRCPQNVFIVLGQGWPFFFSSRSPAVSREARCALAAPSLSSSSSASGGVIVAKHQNCNFRTFRLRHLRIRFSDITRLPCASWTDSAGPSRVYGSWRTVRRNVLSVCAVACIECHRKRSRTETISAQCAAGSRSDDLSANRGSHCMR
jgi:hypothetical protein